MTLTRTAFALAAFMTSAIGAQAAGMVTAKNGMTLYVFDKDEGGVSACYDDCAKKWPPYAAKANAKLTEGWTLVKRTDDTMQWAYDGKPVYFFKGDKAKGDAAGDGMGSVWHVITK
jgi:predicted lipoprotein with Yx(FWY)xxD motif